MENKINYLFEMHKYDFSIFKKYPKKVQRNFNNLTSKFYRLILMKRAGAKKVFHLITILIFIFLYTCAFSYYNNAVQRDLNEILKLREQKRVENWDEFIQEVLEDLKIEEVDLISPEALRKNTEFDKIIDAELKRIVPGLGDFDKGIIVLDEDMFGKDNLTKMLQSIDEENFNLYLSQMISPNRTIPSSRMQGCYNETYDEDLPTMSIVITNRHEPLSTLLRTISSVINRTPRKYLEEIIIVDDNNYLNDLKEKLERYLVTQYPRGLIRLIRVKNRAGLIRGRMIGAHFAIGDVLFFLDAHSEVEPYWAEPLLQRIKEDRKAVVCPLTLGISSETFNYHPGPYPTQDGSVPIIITGFIWEGVFKWIETPKYERERKKHTHSPTRTPTMMGSAFGISRSYFWEMGSYDPGMKVWGGENLELPFRIWQCGGSVEVIPCSLVGHVYRENKTYLADNNEGMGYLYYNMKRVADVWMDEFKDVHELYSSVYNPVGDGSIEKRKKLRERLNCKSFKWYLDNIYKEVFRHKYDSIYGGRLNKIGTNLCFDSLNVFGSFFVGLFECNDGSVNSQIMYISKNNTLNLQSACGISEKVKNDERLAIKFVDCSVETYYKMDKWSWDKNKGMLKNEKVQKCASASEFNIKMIFLEDCDEFNAKQFWKILSVM